MSEASLWKHLRKQMVPRYWAEATRHEDASSSGIADVSFVVRKHVKLGSEGFHGWLELKYRSAAPARPDTICRLEHFTDAQRLWLKNKGEAGGRTFMLLQLGRDYLLFDWKVLGEVGHVTTDELYGLACWCSKGKLNAETLWSTLVWHC